MNPQAKTVRGSGRGANLTPTAGVRLEPTFSTREVSDFLGLKRTAMMALARNAEARGLWPRFLTASGRYRWPASALNNYQARLAAARGVNRPPAVQVLIGGAV